MSYIKQNKSCSSYLQLLQPLQLNIVDNYRKKSSAEAVSRSDSGSLQIYFVTACLVPIFRPSV